MKKSRFEYFLDDYSWLLKSVIVIALILWAMQGSFIVKGMYDEIKNQPPRNIEIEAKMQKEVNGFILELVEKAKANKSYGPKDYFDDYRKIETKKDEFNYPYDPAFYFNRITELQVMAMENVGSGRLYDDHDVSNAAHSFSEWKKRGGPSGDEWDRKIQKLSGKERFEMVFNWVSKAYCRGFFLALFLFIIRMVNRKGIIETILADKKRFFLAVAFWPFFIMKYPYNVVREIIVEAEIRRLGNVFRRLTEREREFVVQVASKNNFWLWLLEFRAENSIIFQRSFATALVSVIIIHLFLPVFSEAREEVSRGGPVVSTDAYEEVVIFSDSDSQPEFQSVCHDMLFSESYLEMPLKASVILKILEGKIKLKSIFRKIEHIPVFGRSFVYLDRFQFNTN